MNGILCSLTQQDGTKESAKGSFGDTIFRKEL